MPVSNRNFANKFIAFLLIVIQSAVLDYYLIQLNRSKYGWAFLGWLAGDIAVLSVYIATSLLGFRYVERRLAEAEQQPCATGTNRDPLHHIGVLPYSFVAWFIYSLVLVGKIICVFKTFVTESPKETSKFDINILEFTFGGTAAVFIAFVGGVDKLASHAQKHYLRWMQHYVLLEIIDCVEFLTLLFETMELDPEKYALPVSVQNAILIFACINIVAPAHALYRLSSQHNRHPEKRNRFFLTQTLVGTLFGNLPYFSVRVYLWHRHSFVTGLFAMKNLIGIIQDTRELVEYFHELKFGRTESGSELGSELAEHHKIYAPIALQNV